MASKINSTDTGGGRPLVLVDVDGVLNAFGVFGVRESLTRHQFRSRAAGYHLVLDRRHPDWFARIAEHADMAWATMWEERAPEDLSPILGFGADWPFLNFTEYWGSRLGGRWGSGIGDHKWPLIHEQLLTNRPVVWIDDDMTDVQMRQAERRDAAGLPTLFVRPDAFRGFDTDDYIRVIRFVRDHSLQEAGAA